MLFLSIMMGYASNEYKVVKRRGCEFPVGVFSMREVRREGLDL